MERNGRLNSLFGDILKLVDRSAVSELKQLFDKNIMSFYSLALAYQRKISDNDGDDEDKLNDLLENLQQPLSGLRHDLPVDDLLKKDNYRQTINSFLLYAPSLMNVTYETKRHCLKSRYAADLLQAYGEGDPYDLCAAYLFCSQKDEMGLHLNTATAVVLEYALARLPWTLPDIFMETRIVERMKPDIYSLDYVYTDIDPDDEADNDDVF